MIAPSRRLIASCLLLMAASLLISLLGLAQGPVPLTIDPVFSALFGDAPRNVAVVVNGRSEERRGGEGGEDLR